MKRWLLVILLLLSVGINIGVLLALASGKIGQRPGPRQPAPLERELARIEGRVEPFVVRMADELALEGEARRSFIDNQRRFFEQTLHARRRFREAQQRLAREIAGPAPDRGQADQLLEQLADAYATQERAFVDNMLSTRELLDEGQRRRFTRFLFRVRQFSQGGARGVDRRTRQMLQERQRRRGQSRSPAGSPPGQPPPG